MSAMTVPRNYPAFIRLTCGKKSFPRRDANKFLRVGKMFLAAHGNQIEPLAISRAVGQRRNPSRNLAICLLAARNASARPPFASNFQPTIFGFSRKPAAQFRMMIFGVGTGS